MEDSKIFAFWILVRNFDGFVKSNISPPLAGGDKGEGDNEPAEIPLLFTLTPALSRRGRGSVFDFLRDHQPLSKKSEVSRRG